MKIELKATNTQWFKKYQLYFLRNMLKMYAHFWNYIYIRRTREEENKQVNCLKVKWLQFIGFLSRNSLKSISFERFNYV